MATSSVVLLGISNPSNGDEEKKLLYTKYKDTLRLGDREREEESKIENINRFSFKSADDKMKTDKKWDNDSSQFVMSLIICTNYSASLENKNGHFNGSIINYQTYLDIGERRQFRCDHRLAKCVRFSFASRPKAQKSHLFFCSFMKHSRDIV